MFVPLLFTLHFNALSLCLDYVQAILFADDTTIYYAYCYFNINKTKYVLFSHKAGKQDW